MQQPIINSQVYWNARLKCSLRKDDTSSVTKYDDVSSYESS